MIIGICASTREGVIGKNNNLPWHIPEDLKQFKLDTINSTIIMGRKTFESIGKALPKRRNIVLSREDIKIPGVEVYKFDDPTFQDILKDRCFVIGGKEVFKFFLNWIDIWKISWIKENYQGDVKINWEEALKGFKLIDVVEFTEFQKCTYKREEKWRES